VLLPCRHGWPPAFALRHAHIAVWLRRARRCGRSTLAIRPGRSIFGKQDPPQSSQSAPRRIFVWRAKRNQTLTRKVSAMRAPEERSCRIAGRLTCRPSRRRCGPFVVGRRLRRWFCRGGGMSRSSLFPQDTHCQQVPARGAAVAFHADAPKFSLCHPSIPTITNLVKHPLRPGLAFLEMLLAKC